MPRPVDCIGHRFKRVRSLARLAGARADWPCERIVALLRGRKAKSAARSREGRTNAECAQRAGRGRPGRRIRTPSAASRSRRAPGDTRILDHQPEIVVEEFGLEVE